ncbi:MAG: LppX_LprAFG lipoprotein [Anaerolineae bacterium]
MAGLISQGERPFCPGEKAQVHSFAVKWLAKILGLLLLGIASCRPAPPPDLPPAEIVQNAAQQMEQLAGFHFRIERTGAPAYVDPPDNSIVFRLAEGDFTAPNRARAVVRVIAPGLVTDVSVISIGEIQWQTNVLTGQWEELPPNWGFNPTVLFDVEVGLQAVLRHDMSNLALAGTETLDEDLLYKVTGQAAGERLYEMSGWLIGPQPVTVTLWVRPESFELVQAEVVEPETDAGEPSVWLVTFSEFGQTTTIEPPLGEQKIP